jgi:hypothetical protein
MPETVSRSDAIDAIDGYTLVCTDAILFVYTPWSPMLIMENCLELIIA